MSQLKAMTRGDTQAWTITVLKDDGSGLPEDITNAVVRMTAKYNIDDLDASAIFQLTSPATIVITDGPNGECVHDSGDQHERAHEGRDCARRYSMHMARRTQPDAMARHVADRARHYKDVRMSSNELLDKSVTKNDLMPGTTVPGSGVWLLNFPAYGMVGGTPELPPFWSLARDWELYKTIYRCGGWASAVYKAVSKKAAQSWDVDGDVPLRVKRAREMLLAFDAKKGWVPGISKHLQSWIMLGNGTHMEVIRQSGARGSKVLGLAHLDSFRCTRTGDPGYPIIYRDRWGREHLLKDYQVISMADMPDPAEMWFGVGHSAAERAWDAILKLEALELYVKQKLTGQRITSMHFVGGVRQEQAAQAIESAKLQAQTQGLTHYMGAAMAFSIDPTAEVKVASVDLVGLPDGFDPEKERLRADLAFANAIGIDPQMINPDLMASRAMGTGAQSRLLAEKAEVVGLAMWDKEFSHNVNEYALDTSTTFTWSERDLQDELQRATISSTRATAASTWATAAGLTPDQVKQIGVDQDELPDEFLPADQTSDTSLTDDAKPEGDAVDPALAGDTEGGAVPTGSVPGTPDAARVDSVTKVVRDLNAWSATLKQAKERHRK